MKIQMQQQSLRLRVDEAELACLLAGESVVNRTALGPAFEGAQQLVLAEIASAMLDGSLQDLRATLPRAMVAEYAQRLPCRDGLVFEIPTGGCPLRLHFDVDIRDSLRERGPRRRAVEAMSDS